MRLIGADALWERHCESCNAEVRESCKTDPVCATLMWVDEAPTIEAEPVKHGKWVEIYHDEPSECDIYGCSECKKTTGILKSEWNYCPNCGARMDGE